jgi:hypothetical protein
VEVLRSLEKKTIVPRVVQVSTTDSNPEPCYDCGREHRFFGGVPHLLLGKFFLPTALGSEFWTD